MQAETTKDGKLFIKASDLKLSTQWLYLMGLAVGVTSTFVAYAHYLYPLLLVGSITPLAYYGGVFIISVAWVCLIKLINKYWLQNKLISKGEIVCSSSL